MRRSVAELIERTAARLSAQGVDSGLSELAGRLDVDELDPAGLEDATASLLTQADALRTAAEDVERLHASVGHLAAVLKFAEEWWPVRKGQLARTLARDRDEGLREVLGDWYEAISHGRIAAADRLLELDLPLGGELVADRLRVASQALQQADWQAAQAILRLGADGVVVGGITVPGARVRRDLRLVLIRLALHKSLADDAEFELHALKDETDPAVVALRCRWQRLHDSSGPDDCLGTLGREAAVDIDVATELIAKARADGQHEVALNAARVAIDAVPALFDVEEDFATPARETPPEIWLAMGERALREEDSALLVLALARAEQAAEANDYALWAEIAELRLEGAAITGLDTASKVEALISAGSNRVWSESLDRAREHFERALNLDPDNIDGSLRLADCLLVTVGNQPLAQGRDQIQRAADLIAKVRDKGRLEPSLSWGYLTEAVAHRQLARGMGRLPRAHLWLAFLAVCRSLVQAPMDSGRWSELASSADDLGMSLVSLASAEEAVALAADDAEATDRLILSRTNAGRLREALEQVTEGSSPWHDALRGYIVLRLGDPAAAVQALTRTTIDPTWSWATETLITALLLSHNDDEAAVQARAALARSASRLDEREFVSLAALASLVVGDAARAEELTQRLLEVDQGRDFLWTVATARLIRGDGPGALAALEERSLGASTIRELDEWSSIVGPQVRHLAERAGATIPSFESIDRAVERRRAELEQLSDPIIELDDAAIPEHRLGASLACAMAAALIHLSREDQDAALEALRPALKQHPDDEELVALRDRADAEGDRDASTRPGRQAEEQDESGLYPGSAWVVKADLPASWFEADQDPQNTHPLFTRYLPEMRVRSPVSVPPVAIRADLDLDPDRYRITAGEGIRDEGRVSPGFAYLSRDALELLPDEFQSLAQEDTEPGRMRVPLLTIERAGALGKLLSMPASELVARKIGDVAQEHYAASTTGGVHPSQ